MAVRFHICHLHVTSVLNYKCFWCNTVIGQNSQLCGNNLINRMTVKMWYFSRERQMMFYDSDDYDSDDSSSSCDSGIEC